MSVMKTQWCGPNAERRFRTCCNNSHGYHLWIDEVPIRPRTLEIIKELQEQSFERETKFRAKINRYVERHEDAIEKVKKK
ncbi:hypothetical protein OROMI_005762 [Orobanche minor]